MLSNCDYKYQKILFILMNIIFIKFSGSDFGSRGPQQGKGKNENRSSCNNYKYSFSSAISLLHYIIVSYPIPPFHSLTLHLFIAPLLYPLPHFTQMSSLHHPFSPPFPYILTSSSLPSPFLSSHPLSRCEICCRCVSGLP